MKVSTAVSHNEWKVVIYLAILVAVFFVCKECIDLFLGWANGAFQSSGGPMIGQ